MPDDTKPMRASARWIIIIVVIATCAAGVYSYFGPGYEVRPMLENEVAAINTIHGYAVAQLAYHESDHDENGLKDFAPKLEALIPFCGKAFPEQVMRATGPSTAYRGYYFIMFRYPSETWKEPMPAFVAMPSQPNVTGRMTFFIDGAARTFSKDCGGEPITELPKDPYVEGWDRFK